MKQRKFVSLLLAAAMALSLTACAGAPAAGSSTPAAPAAETAEEAAEPAAASDAFAGLPEKNTPATPVYASPDMYTIDLSKKVNINMYMVGDTPNDWEAVCAEMNKYLEPYNTTFSATFLSWADYTTLYPLALQGDYCDIIYTASWCFLGSESAKGSFVELTDDFIQQYMPLTYRYQDPDSYIESLQGGKLYCIPQNMTEASAKYVAIRKDLADKYGIGELKTWEDFANYLTTIAEKETPESGIYAYAAAGENKELWDVWRQEFDERSAVEDDYLCLGYLFDGSDKAPAVEDIQLIYDMDVFKDFAHEMKRLADAGVWSRSALTNSTTKDEAFGALQSAADAWNTSLFPYIDQAEQTEGVECACYDLGADNMAAAAYGAGGLAIAEGSQNPERAAMVLDLFENDTYLNRLMTLGIEGVHYEMIDEDHYRELEKSKDFAIWVTAASWSIKNYKLTDGAMDPRRQAIEEETEARGVASPTRTFSLDTTEIADYVTAIKNVMNDYVPMLQLGLVDDVDATIAEFRQKLDDAGMQIYLDTFREQYEAWLAAQ